MLKKALAILFSVVVLIFSVSGCFMKKNTLEED